MTAYSFHLFIWTKQWAITLKRTNVGYAPFWGRKLKYWIKTYIHSNELCITITNQSIYINMIV